MKIRLENDGGYAGLEKVKFPVEVEAYSFSARGTAHIHFNIMQAIPGYKYNPECRKGSDYIFFTGEYTLLEETPEEVPVVAVAEKRKKEFTDLLNQYVEAIADVDWQSENGTHEEWLDANRLRDEIRQKIDVMIEEGI